MIIYLQKSACIDVIRQILTDFGEHTLNELVGYFPVNDFDYIVTGIKILESKRVIECVRKNGIEYYRLIPSKNRSLVKNAPKRSDYLQALAFLRVMINDIDDKGNLKNNIPYFCRDSYPTTMFFECNGNIYDVYYIAHDRVSSTVALINRLDESDTYVDDMPSCRIVITDSVDDFTKIDIKKLKYRVTIEPDGSLTFS